MEVKTRRERIAEGNRLFSLNDNYEIRYNGGVGSGIKGHRTPEKNIANNKNNINVGGIENKKDVVKKKKNKPITISKLGKYKDLDELGKKAEKYYKNKIQGTHVINKEAGRIDFNRVGIDETINKSQRHPDVLKTIPKIGDIVRKGEKVEKKKTFDKDGKEITKKRKDGAIFFGIEHEVKVRNEIKKALALIRESPKGLKDFYVLYLKEK